MNTSELKFHPSLCSDPTNDAIRRVAAGIVVVRRRGNPHRKLALTFRHLGKLNPLQAGHLQDLADCFRCLIGEWMPDQSPLIVGLAESGIVPAFAMQHACAMLSIASDWCHSSRNPCGDIRFVESHSHAPHHFLSTELVLRDDFSELWIVDDEITTGATLVNLIHSLSQIRLFKSVKIFTMMDNRPPASTAVFCSLGDSLGISIELLSLISFRGDPKFLPITNTTEATTSLPIEFVWGESISKALPLLLRAPEKSIQQVTLSRWMVDGIAIRRHQQLNEDYSVYNMPDNENAVMPVGLSSCAP